MDIKIPKNFFFLFIDLTVFISEAQMQDKRVGNLRQILRGYGNF